MKILDILINKLKGKRIVSEEQSIVTLDDKPIYLPNYQELTKEDKIIVDNYKHEININNFDTLISYTNELRNKSKDITNLLIKFLYELEQISESLAIKKDLGREAKINQYELVDYEIKFAKITSLNNILTERRKELELKILGFLKYKEEYQRHNLKHNIEYLGILGRNKKVKRELEDRGLKNLESSLKVAIIALDYNLEVSRNSVLTADRLINSLETYLKKQRDYYAIRDTKFYDKLDFYKKVNELIFENKLIGIQDLDKILCNNHLIYHDILPFMLADIEVQIDLEKEKYKDNFIKYFRKQYNNLLNIPKTLDNVNTLIKIINELLTIQEVYQEDISKELRNNLYEMKFFLLSKKVIIDYKTYEERKYYLDIIKREYEQFIKLNSNTVKYIKNNIKLLLSDNKTLEDILLKIHPNYLKIILLVNYPNYYREFFDNYPKNLNIKSFEIEYDSNLGNNKILVINNNIFFKLQKAKLFSNKSNIYYEDTPDIDESYKELALDIICSCKKYIFVDDLITIKNGTLTFAPGITKITSSHMNYSDVRLIKHIKFPNSLKEIGECVFEEFENLQELICPPLLETIGYNAFKNCQNLKEIFFNNNLKEIRHAAFFKCYGLKRVIFPASLEIIGNDAFSYCINLKGIFFEGQGPKKIKYKTFFKTSLHFNDIILPSKVEEIEDKAFDSDIQEKLIINHERLPKTLKK